MKIKNKGKVHPSPSSSNSSNDDGSEAMVLSVLSLLPAAILALASVLSLEDRQVLAYMLTRSLKTTSNACSNSSTSSAKKKPSKKPQTSSSSNNNNSGVGVGVHGHGHGHNKPPMFECECFDCYTSFWVRWDSSPNRDLIHRVIEAFEDHLTSGERPNTRPNKKRSRSDKLGRRDPQKPTSVPAPTPPEEDSAPHVDAAAAAVVAQNAVVSGPPEEMNEKGGSERQNDAVEATEEEGNDVAVVLRTMAASGGAEHRGLARKVLPDVLGLLNSRLWSLWSPNA